MAGLPSQGLTFRHSRRIQQTWSHFHKLLSRSRVDDCSRTRQCTFSASFSLFCQAQRGGNPLYTCGIGCLCQTAPRAGRCLRRLQCSCGSQDQASGLASNHLGHSLDSRLTSLLLRSLLYRVGCLRGSHLQLAKQARLGIRQRSVNAFPYQKASLCKIVPQKSSVS